MGNETETLTSHEIAALYAAHGGELKRFLNGVLRDTAATADCLQATFTKLLLRGHETQPETRRAWLFKVAFQEAMLLKRKAATSDRILRKAAWHCGDDTQVRSPEQQLVSREQLQEVELALEALSPEQRQIVNMRMYEDKTFATIAEELQIPLGTALGRMRNALIRLRAAMQDRE